MKEIVFVTHNKGKAKSAEKYFNDLKFSTYDFELNEPRSDDIQEIATAKVKQAYEIVKKPCIALDTGFFIDELNGFPKAFVNFSLDTIGIDGILKLMEGKENRKCKFEECLAYHDGKEIHYFLGKHPGNLSNKIQGIDRDEKWSDLWYIFTHNPDGISTIAVDPTIIPLGSRVYIPGYGEAIASDTGLAIKGNKIDLFLNSEKECIDFGKQNVTLYVLSYPE